MPITRNFTLYLNAGISVAPTVHVNQSDRGEQWIFTLLDDKGQKYTPSDGALIGVKADGHAIVGVTGTVGSNGDVYITETQQMTAAAGKAIFELTIDGMTHGTANFIVQVEKKPTEDAVLSKSDLSIIQQGIDSVTPAAIKKTVSEYLAEHMTNPPIDPTLTVSNAAADAKVTGDKITDLKNALNDSDSREYILDGIYYQMWETGQRYIDSGEEKWTSSSSRMSTKRGTYINFKSGDVVVLKNTLDYQFLVGYSTDNGSTWSGGSNRTSPLTIEADSIGFICIKKASGTFTDDEIKNVAKNKIFILRDGTNIVSDNRQKIDAVTMAMATFNNSEIVAVNFGMMHTWISANATSVVTSNKFTESIPAVAGDMFAIKAEESISYPLLYTGIGIVVYEVSSGDTVVKTTYYTDISDVIEYEVTHSNATKISIYGYLTAESGSITTGYNEIFDYKLSVAKQMESDLEIFLTENGNAWEV